MNEKEKSLELSKLMGWRVHVYDTHVNFEGGVIDGVLQPYEKNKSGLAQFGVILLNNIEVFEYASAGGFIQYKDGYIKPTQENILDEILLMNGVKL